MVYAGDFELKSEPEHLLPIDDGVILLAGNIDLASADSVDKISFLVDFISHHSAKMASLVLQAVPEEVLTDYKGLSLLSAIYQADPDSLYPKLLNTLCNSLNLRLDFGCIMLMIRRRELGDHLLLQLTNLLIPETPVLEEILIALGEYYAISSSDHIPRRKVVKKAVKLIETNPSLIDSILKLLHSLAQYLEAAFKILFSDFYSCFYLFDDNSLDVLSLYCSVLLRCLKTINSSVTDLDDAVIEQIDEYINPFVEIALSYKEKPFSIQESIVSVMCQLALIGSSRIVCEVFNRDIDLVRLLLHVTHQTTDSSLIQEILRAINSLIKTSQRVANDCEAPNILFHVFLALGLEDSLRVIEESSEDNQLSILVEETANLIRDCNTPLTPNQEKEVCLKVRQNIY